MKSAVKTEQSNNSKAVANHISLRPHSVAPNFIVQAKLQVGEPDDEYEQEADRVADTVMRMPEPFIQQKVKEDEDIAQAKHSKPIQTKHRQISAPLNGTGMRPIHPWKPVKISNAGKNDLIQRRINYLAQATGQQAAPYLTAFDNTVTQVEQSLRGVTGQMADDIRAAMARARALRTAGRVTVWQISGGLVYASYDNATDQLRLHTNWGVGQPTSRRTVVHEAIHALHGRQHPRLRRLYAQILAAGGTTNRNIAILLLQYKAWTEYWAYRRSQEHYNLIHPQHASDAHRAALAERDVRGSIRRATIETGSQFEPWSWSPPRRIP